ncbi:MAG: 30S ribosomal protein S3 [Candidatus Gribaldobacteria bacterium]|nr:30S ribosomal protein S3 [Candidatus Gribaldobacteria bacterium]
MSHKSHPKVLRIREIKDWLSRGFYQRNFPRFLEEDCRIRDFLNEKLPQGTVQDVEIERGQTVLKVIIKTSRPALIIGRGGKGVEELKYALEKELSKRSMIRLLSPINRRDLKIEILEVRNMWASSSLTAQWVAGQLEKMVPFRRVIKMAIGKSIEQKEVQGVRVELSGRLNGVEISRREWLKEGRLPRQNFRAIIDYHLAQAHCTYGVIGVKVWIYKGESFIK